MTRQTGFPVITAEALAELRRRIGIPVRRPEPYIETATRDAVRHWMAGIGDRNPFWLDAGVAPPTILFAMDRIVSGYVGGLPGIHAMYGGTDFRWQRPIRIGDAIVGDSVSLDLVEKPSQFARRAIQQICRTTFRNQTRDIVCEADSWCFRTERDTARERGKYSAVEPPRYTEREIDAIATAYRAEEARGRAPRYWDDVTVGDALPDVVKGPLTVTSVIAFVQGWGSLYVRAHGLAFENVRASSRARHSERLRRPRAAGARALGRRDGVGRRGTRRLRLRPRACRLARAPGHQLDGRRGILAPTQRAGAPARPDRRHDVVVDPRRDAVGPEERGERHGDRAPLDRAEDRTVEGRGRIEDDGDAIAVLDAAPREEVREAGRPRRQLTKAVLLHPAVVELDAQGRSPPDVAIDALVGEVQPRSPSKSFHSASQRKARSASG